MIDLKKVNLTLLLVASPFVIAGCGGASGGEPQIAENNASEVAIQIELQTSAADQAISEIANHSTLDKKADWIPTIAGTEKLSSATTEKLTSITPTLIEKIISNGDSTDKWKVYDTNPAGAEITSVYDQDKASNVIEVSGSGQDNGYVIGYSWAEGTSWNDTENKSIKWSMKFSEEYMIYVRVSTRKGYRYLYYTSANMNYGISGYDAPHYIHNGLGVASQDGTWRTFSRDLSADLKRHEPDNAIDSVDGFYVRGSGFIDDLELTKTAGERINEVTYSEGTTTNGWSVYDNDPQGTITTENGMVKLTGGGKETGYMLGSAWDASKSWNNTINKEISWDMKYCEEFVAYVSVETAQGHRFLTYTPLSEKTFASNPNYGQGVQVNGDYTYIHLGLNPNTKSCSVETVTRNLELDLKRYEPNNSIISVNAFLIRGSGSIGNVKMFDTNSDGDFDNSTN